MAPQYDFSQGVRGKHATAMRDVYTMAIHHSDDTTEVRDVTPRPGKVALDSGLRAYFPDSDAVNRALRRLIGQGTQPSAPGDTTYKLSGSVDILQEAKGASARRTR